MLVALTHVPSPAMNDAVRTFVDVEPIDVARVQAQHAGYRAMLDRAGARVVVLDDNRALADSVFIEDTAVVVDELAIVASMGAPSRQAEPAAIARVLRAYREVVVAIEPPATLEGGDVLRIGRTILVGLTRRTNRAGVEALASALAPFGYDVRAVRVTDCLHLKSACTALPDGALLAQPRWLDLRDVGGFEIVSVPEPEPHAANVVLAGERVCVSSAYPETAALVRRRGFIVETTDLSELAKAEGCATCLSILFEA